MKKFLFLIFMVFFAPSFVSAAGDVVINEIAWMGTKANSSDEWIELKNNVSQEIDLSGFKIYEQNNGEVEIISLVGKIAPDGYFLIERSDDNTITDIAADLFDVFGGGGLSNNGERLILKDNAGNILDDLNFSESWPAGVASPGYFSMERDTAGWHTNDGITRNGKDADGNFINGTPRQLNSGGNQNNSQDNQSEGDSQNSENISSGSSSSSPQNLIADAGPNIAGVVGAEIVFDGSKSINPNGGEMSYSWNFGNGETASGKTAKYVYKYPGRYIAVLTVSSDSYQNSDQAEVLIYSAGIFISEFLPSPDGADEENEWIEIANDSDSIADISDFQMGDGSSTIFKIPKNTFIAPRSFLVFARKATKISLNNDEDKVVLYYSNGEVVDSVGYDGGAKEGFSAARTSDGRFLWTKNITPGTANIFLSEPVVKASAASPAQKIVSENKGGELKIVSVTNFSIVGGQSNGGLISFLPEVSAKTVDGYDESDSAATADGSFENGEKINQSASLIDSLSAKVGSAFGGKNKTAAVFILVPSIILSALAFVFRRKFWR